MAEQQTGIVSVKKKPSILERTKNYIKDVSETGSIIPSGATRFVDKKLGEAGDKGSVGGIKFGGSVPAGLDNVPKTNTGPSFIDRVFGISGAEGATLDGKPGFENRGIVTAAPETKVAETKRMAGEGFFSPQNFQRSGVPDATIMTKEQMGQALTGDPGYKRFGTLDREGTQAAKDTAAFNQRVKSDFFSPVKADARSITERREANVQSMRDEARERDTQFRETGQQTFGGRVTERRSGDDTYGTNVMSNPAFGFRSKMSAENQKRYDASATEATKESRGRTK